MRNKIGIALPGVKAAALLGAITLAAPNTVYARSSLTFFGTIGRGIAAGTVLGASTLPFYDQPGEHLMNLAYGAGAGVVSMLVANYVFHAFDDGSGEEEDLAQSSHALYASASNSDSEQRRWGAAETAALTPGRVQPAQFYTPLVSLSW